MSKFLIAVWPFAGHYFPLVAVAHALRRRGHTVAFYTGAKAQPVVVGEGFTCFHFERIDEQRVDEIMFTRAAYTSRRQPLQLQALLREWLLGTLPGQVADLTPILDTWQPDVIVSETSMLGPMLVLSETRRVPVAVFSTVVACLLPGRDAPPYGPGLPLARNWRGRLLARLVRAGSDLLGMGFRRRANLLRRGYGLAPLHVSVTEFTGQMPLYLVPSVPEFDYGRRDLPPSAHYVGPCLWNPPGRAPQSESEWLAGGGNGRPLVHVTEGTMHTDKPLILRTAAQALGGLPVDVIMTTGGSREPEELDLGPLGANIQVQRWIAHDDLLSQVDLVVTTGGAGTVMAALAAGVPLVVIPTEWDKFENAQRVAEAGAGLRLPLRHCTPERFRAAVDRVLTEPRFRQNARRLAEILSRADGPGRAAELLEELSLGQPMNVPASSEAVQIN
jgi:MGT family glycosyltransferase